MDTSVSNHSELKRRLISLRAEEQKYKALIINDVKEIYGIVQNPAPVIMRTVKVLASDKDFRVDLLTVGLNFAANYLTNKTVGPISNIYTLVKGLLAKNAGKTGNNKSSNIVNLLSKIISGNKTSKN